jgi:hypothetical protein
MISEFKELGIVYSDYWKRIQEDKTVQEASLVNYFFWKSIKKSIIWNVLITPKQTYWYTKKLNVPSNIQLMTYF